MLDKNIIIFSYNRTGSTSLCLGLHNKYKIDHYPVDKPRKDLEFLVSIEAFIPYKVRKWIMQIPEVFNSFWEGDYTFLNNWYAQNHGPLTEFQIRKPMLKGNKILFIDKFLQAHPDYPYFLKKNFYQDEQARRINLSNSVAKLKNFMVWKYFPGHVYCNNTDDWIDRKYNYVIGLIRDHADTLASEQYKKITGISNKTQKELDISQYDNINKKLPSILNSNNRFVHNNRPDVASSRLTDNYIKDKLTFYSSYYDRLENIKPDMIISYEWLLKNNFFDKQPLVKLNKFSSEDFFKSSNQYEKVKATKQPKLFNLKLAEKLLL